MIITIDGPDNIGKTTLINKLAERDHATVIAFPSKNFRETVLWLNAKELIQKNRVAYVEEFIVEMRRDMQRVLHNLPEDGLYYIDRCFASTIVYQFIILYPEVKDFNTQVMWDKFNRWVNYIMSFYNVDPIFRKMKHYILDIPKMSFDIKGDKPSEVTETHELFDEYTAVPLLYRSIYTRPRLIPARVLTMGDESTALDTVYLKEIDAYERRLHLMERINAHN